MNIVNPILFQCRINAEQPAICAPGTQFNIISYAQLEYMLNNLTRALFPSISSRARSSASFCRTKSFTLPSCLL